MHYEIKGGAFPVVVCDLHDGEQMITERGSMVWMTPNMRMETRGGGLGRMFAKAFSGESMFQNIYTAQGDGMITFGSSFPGKILALDIRPGQEMILQKSAFLAAETGVELSIHFNKKLGAGLFGGEGFIMQRLSGRGTAFAEIDGELVEYELKAGEQLVVDTGNVAGFTDGVKMDIREVPGLKNKLLGGEGLAPDHAHQRRRCGDPTLHPDWKRMKNMSEQMNGALSGGQKGKTISTSGRFPSVLCHAPDLSSFALHVLAMLLMLCDHLWATLLPQYAMLTHIGRIAFPIFAFLLAEGARHTHDPKNICSAC